MRHTFIREGSFDDDGSSISVQVSFVLRISSQRVSTAESNHLEDELLLMLRIEMMMVVVKLVLIMRLQDLSSRRRLIGKQLSVWSMVSGEVRRRVSGLNIAPVQDVFWSTVVDPVIGFQLQGLVRHQCLILTMMILASRQQGRGDSPRIQKTQ